MRTCRSTAFFLAIAVSLLTLAGRTPPPLTAQIAPRAATEDASTDSRSVASATSDATRSSSAEQPTPAEREALAKRRRDMARLVRQIRLARGEAEQAAIIDEAQSLGTEAVEAVYDVLTRQLSVEIRSYMEQFNRQAMGVVHNNVRMVGPEEIAERQRAVLSLAANPELTEEMLKKRGDPAFERLREILTTDRDTVLRASQPLAELRRSLLAKAAPWDRCAQILYDAAPDDEEKRPAAPRFDELLARQEKRAAELSLILNERSRQVLQASADLSRRLDPEEAACMYRLNATRAVVGLPPLAVDLRLAAAARSHSHDMKTEGFLAHESPLEGKKTFLDRARLAGTTASGEIIYAGSTKGSEAHDAWLHSPRHFRNLLGDHRRVGVGRFEDHFTGLFGR